MNLADDPHLRILQQIEIALAQEFQANDHLLDLKVAFALGAAIIAFKKTQGYAKNESVSGDHDIQGIISACIRIAKEHVKPTGPLLASDFIKCIEKVQRSVERHANHGPRAYFNFVRRYLPQ